LVLSLFGLDFVLSCHCHCLCLRPNPLSVSLSLPLPLPSMFSHKKPYTVPKPVAKAQQKKGPVPLSPDQDDENNPFLQKRRRNMLLLSEKIRELGLDKPIISSIIGLSKPRVKTTSLPGPRRRSTRLKEKDKALKEKGLKTLPLTLSLTLEHQLLPWTLILNP
jgi:hypothetical protein